VQTLESILLVDDDHPTNFLHTRLLKKMGYAGDIHEMYNAEDALAYLRQADDNPRAQLLFLDLNMPRLNGWEFLQLYSEYFTEAERAIVVLTTSLNPDDEIRAHNSPFVTAFHRKPLTVDMIKAIVQPQFAAFWNDTAAF